MTALGGWAVPYILRKSKPKEVCVFFSGGKGSIQVGEKGTFRVCMQCFFFSIKLRRVFFNEVDKDPE